MASLITNHAFAYLPTAREVKTSCLGIFHVAGHQRYFWVKLRCWATVAAADLVVSIGVAGKWSRGAK